MLVGREEEFARLEAMLDGALGKFGTKLKNNSKTRGRKSIKQNSCNSGEDGAAGEKAEEPVKPLAIYVSGKPGTGKTATVQAVVRKLQAQRGKKFHFVPIDCFSFSTFADLEKKVVEKLGRNPPASSSASSSSRVSNRTRSASSRDTVLAKLFNEADRPILLLLDEVDNLGKDKEVLYKVFGWPAQFDGKVIVIGIANTLDLIERQLPKLKLNGSLPELVTFAAYTSGQLIAILEQHLKANKMCLDRKAIELCARKVSALTGDVRKALDIAEQISENLEEEVGLALMTTTDENGKEAEKENVGMALSLAKTPQKTPSKKGRQAEEERTPMKQQQDRQQDRQQLKRPNDLENGEVTPKKQARCVGGGGGGSACREVLKVINKTMLSPCQRSKLPSQTRTLLATLMRLVSVPGNCSSLPSTPQRAGSVFSTPSKTPKGVGASSLSVSRDRLFSAYLMVCEQLRLAAPDPDEVDEMLALLESQSMVRTQQQNGAARGGKGARVCFTVEMSIARAQINDNALIDDIERMDL